MHRFAQFAQFPVETPLKTFPRFKVSMTFNPRSAFLNLHQVKFFPKAHNGWWSKNNFSTNNLLRRFDLQSWPMAMFELQTLLKNFWLNPTVRWFTFDLWSTQALIELNIEVATFRDLLLSVGSSRCFPAFPEFNYFCLRLQTFEKLYFSQ